MTLNTAALNLGQPVSGSTVIINNSGAQTGSGLVTATTALDLNGSGALALTVNTPIIGLNSTGGLATVDDTAAASVSISGAATGGSLTLFAGPTTVTGALGGANENLTFNTGALSGSGTVSPKSPALKTSGDVGANGNALNTQASQITLNTGSGANVFLNQNAAIPLSIGRPLRAILSLSAGRHHH